MSTTPTTTSGITLGAESIHGHHHRGKRLRHFFLPNGRKVHIALSPEEADSLRQRLAVVPQDTPFDLVISGSPEHLSALKEAHSHHETRRQSLREKHGEAYDEFEHVRAELDALGSELHMLTDHAVSLDANFSKYGYSAHLRTYDDHSTPGSSAASLHGDDAHEKKDWSAEKRNGKIMKIYKKPTVRQYFHKGLLWRASDQAEVASFELFVDLLYVGILAINGDHASEAPVGSELLRFSVTFIMSWKLWSDLSLLVSWFETDDIIQRVSILFIMACLFGLTTNMLEAFEHTYSQLVAFFLAARLFMGGYCLAMASLVPMVRGMMIVQAILALVPSILWIGSIYVEMPNRLAIIWMAIFLDLTGGVFIIAIIRGAKRISARLGVWSDKIFEFYPAVNIEHKTERTNAFVSLVFGYSVVAILYQNSSSFGLNAFFGKAILGLLQAFVFNWIYFELDGADLYTHAIRRSVVSAVVWGAIHLPFIMSYVLGGAALSRLVMATDCPDADEHDLTHFYAEKSEHEIPSGLRWFYCVGFGLALLMMGVISLTHVHKEAPAGERIKKRYRLANRAIVCVILFCLPTADKLNSLQLISVVTGLIIWVLLVELWGMSCRDDRWFGEKRQCKYTAKCGISKKDLESHLKDGTTINVERFSNKGEKGMYELS
ncbi:bacterial low temperature requirement A protein-domain-containing protein [Bisporella sp. PMI_857]|nr:bacterial low temperature requirement A protein-domain-containing protein [Bisporella sp. PMI_857]